MAVRKRVAVKRVRKAPLRRAPRARTARVAKRRTGTRESAATKRTKEHLYALQVRQGKRAVSKKRSRKDKLVARHRKRKTLTAAHKLAISKGVRKSWKTSASLKKVKRVGRRSYLKSRRVVREKFVK